MAEAGDNKKNHKRVSKDSFMVVVGGWDEGVWVVGGGRCRDEGGWWRVVASGRAQVPGMTKDDERIVRRRRRWWEGLGRW